MKKRAPFGPAVAKLEEAIERAEQGNPQPLLFLVRDALGHEAMRVLSNLVYGRVKLANYKAVFMPSEAAAIRAEYFRRKGLHPEKTREQLLGSLVESFGRREDGGWLSEDTFADIVFGKHTYEEEGGEKKRKRSPRQRKK